METNYHAQQTPQFRVLSDEQIKRVYQATLECLKRTGVNIHNAEARQLLAQAGAHVDGIRVRIPPHIIQDAVAANPRSFTIWGRDGKHRMQYRTRPCLLWTWPYLHLFYRSRDWRDAQDPSQRPWLDG